MKIKELTNNDLYSFMRMGEILGVKYYRESTFNKQSEMEYVKINEILNKLYTEANKRLNNLK